MAGLVPAIRPPMVRARMAVTRPAIHPGEHLADELQELGMSAAELARQLAVPDQRLSSFLTYFLL